MSGDGAFETEDSTYSSKALWIDTFLDIANENRIAKDFKVHQALASLLPQGSTLTRILKASEPLWQSGQKRRIPGAKQHESLEDFLNHALANGSPFDIAQVLQAISFRSDNAFLNRMSTAVDRLILSDQDYMTSLEGLNRAIVQGHLHSDCGRTRQAWQIWRRAIMYAQMQGLHKVRLTPEAELIWWALFGLDRSVSMMLGMPYAIPESHCNMEFRLDSLPERSRALRAFRFRLGQIIGKVIDHQQTSHSYNMPQFMDLEVIDRELSQLPSQMPPEMWLLDALPPKNDMEQARQWREVVFNQLSYYQTYIALYLPYLLRSLDNPKWEHLRRRCLQASRKFLQLYHRLRHPEAGFLLKCRAFDSVGCAATIIVILVLWTHARSGTKRIEDCSDWKLVETTMDLYKRFLEQQDEEAARQSYRTLQRFSETRYLRANVDPGRTKFNIPFFEAINADSTDGFIVNFASTNFGPSSNLGTSMSFAMFPVDSSAYMLPPGQSMEAMLANYELLGYADKEATFPQLNVHEPTADNSSPTPQGNLEWGFMVQDI
jgi:hypothetical protein